MAEDGQPWHPFISVESGATLGAMATQGDSAESEAGADFDFRATLPTRSGTWNLQLEATAEPGTGRTSHSGQFMNNRDAAISPYAGQARLTELRYELQALGGNWSLGLLDSKVFIDSSAVANDDKEQFLGAAFTNNPTIAIPDSSVGIAYLHAPGPASPGYTILTTARSSQPGGLAAGEEHVFIAAEAFGQLGALEARAGIWTERRAPGEASDGNTVGEHGGLYASVDGQWSQVSWNLRVGVARQGFSKPATFVGAALQIPVRQNLLGFGVGHGTYAETPWVDPPNTSSHLEIHYRFEAMGRVMVTPALQYQRRKGPDGQEKSFSACIRLRVVI